VPTPYPVIPNPRPRRLLVALVLIASALTAPAASPQEVDSGGLVLSEVLQATLDANPDVQLAAQQLEAAGGVLLVQGSPFDSLVQATAVSARLNTTDPLARVDALRNNLSYGVGLQRQFRNGSTLISEVGVSRSALSTVPGTATPNTAVVGLTLSTPLLRDRGGAVSAAGERAARNDYESSRLGLRHTVSASLLTAAVSYWDYLAAHQRHGVFRSSEDRARRMVEQTRVLVEAEERTATELTQITGNMASKRVAALNAEVALIESRERLGLAVGFPADRIPALPPPATDFPVPAADASLDAVALQQLAYGRRDDLAAISQDLLAAQTLADAARNDLKPRLDFSVTTGYNGAEVGLGFERFFSPLYRRSPRLDASFRLSYDFLPANSLARGHLLQNTSLYEQRRVVYEDTRRRIATGVAVAVDTLRLAAAGVRESEEAVRLTDLTVQAELRKFQLGMSTLFDVIQAEEGLTTALLGQIQSKRNYAVAIASVRFQTGVLVAGTRDNPSVNVASLTTPP
jgi:outer membrane protein